MPDPEQLKVLLVNPPAQGSYPVLPLGLAYLAAILEKNRYPVRVIDAWADRLSEEEIRRQIREYRPRLVGVTAMSPVYPQAQKAIKIARAAAPEAEVILGGVHASARPRECLDENPGLSLAVAGEGEETLLEILRVLRGELPLSKVRGIAYREEGAVRLTPPRGFLKDLDQIPFPARHLFPWRRYRTHPPYGRYGTYSSIMATRGCPFQCVYCSRAAFGKTIRYRSSRNVIEEIRKLQTDYGVKELHFYDDNLTLKQDWAQTFCHRLLEEGIRIAWSCTTRVDLVNPELLGLMKEAGCWLISYGVESGSQEVLDTAKKGYNLRQVEEAFAWTRKAGIKTHAYFMIGLPGETEETVERSIALALHLRPYTTSWGGTVIFPGTELEEMAGSEKAAYTRFSFGEGVYRIWEGNLSAGRIRALVRRAYLRFYLRPGYILSLVGELKSPRRLVQLTGALWNVLREAVSPR